MLKKCVQLLVICVTACLLPVASAHALDKLNGIALTNTDSGLRVTLALSGPVKYYLSTLHNPERLVVDLLDTRLHTRIASVPLANTPVKRLRSGIRKGDDLRLVFELRESMGEPKGDLVATQLAINLTAKDGKRVAAAKPQPVKVADTGGERDVIIAIDAGHGGKDTGAIGAGHLEEKRVTLAIARALAERVNRVRGYKAVLTRNSDIFLPLKTRRDLARKAEADLMVSIHADSFADRTARGSSVFALSNRGATSTMAAFLANNENNADAIGGVPVEGKDDDLVKVLTDLSLSSTMDSSLRIGKDVLHSIGGIAQLHSRRVEQAAFVVLKSPDTPSILVETGFVSNPGEARHLASQSYQSRMADAIFSGINRYFSQNPPPNTYLAAKLRGGDTVASNP